MKHRPIAALLTLMLVSGIFTIDASAAGKASLIRPKAAGRTSSTILNTILNGVGSPNSSLGIDGDFYIDVKALTLYGPKTKGRWIHQQSLKGQVGATGQSGVDGDDGKNGIDAKSVSLSSIPAGPQGTVGPVGPAGSAGPAGPAGIAGSAGPAGSAGISGVVGRDGPMGPQGAQGVPGSGSTGPAGISGSSGAVGPVGPIGPQGTQGASGSGSTGAQGPSGSQGSTGLQGSTGAQGTVGTKGETGTAGSAGAIGATGPSSISTLTIPSWNLLSNTQFTSSTSAPFGTLQAGKAYHFSIILHGVTTSAGDAYGVEVSATSGVAPSYQYLIFENTVAIQPSLVHRYTFMIEGTIQVGSSDISLTSRVIDGSGNIGVTPMVISGKAFITLIGTIG